MSVPNTWFTSDLHFDHKNIIKHCNRPFSDVNHMNEMLIQNFNELVKPEDTTYFLGDVTFGLWEYLQRMNGKKILIWGNHDNMKEAEASKAFENIYHYFELRGFHNFPIVLMHFPIQFWNRAYRGSMHFHGHSHGDIDNSGIRRVDVGVDCWDYKPVHIDTLISKLDKVKVERDHHGR